MGNRIWMLGPNSTPTPNPSPQGGGGSWRARRASLPLVGRGRKDGWGSGEAGENDSNAIPLLPASSLRLGRGSGERLRVVNKAPSCGFGIGGHSGRPGSQGRRFLPGPRFDGQVVFITGASSGVGRAAARAFAKAGAKVGLLAREKTALEETRAELAALGAVAEAFPADVADADAVFAAAEACAARLGPIDIWVNNAMTTVFGKIGQLSPQEFRRVTEVTYLGYVHGTMAALKQMEPRDSGVIVQVGSALAYRGIPLQAAYCGAKHAIQGFTDSLRTELLHDGSGIRVTSVHLPAVNTTQFDWARTKRPAEPRPVAPVFSSRAAANAILHAAANPQREYWLGSSTAMTILGALALPAFMDWYLSRGVVEGQDRDSEVAPDRKDNLMEPVEGLHDPDGAFEDETSEEAVLLPATGTLLAVAAGALLAAGFAGAAIGRSLESGRRRRWLD